MKVRNTSILLVTLALAFCVTASATDLSGNFTADNGFFAFVSTNDAVLGTPVAAGGNWSATYTFGGVTLTPGVTNYLHIEVINWGGAGGFIGDFTLSDAGFHFANTTQFLVTETTDWVGSYNNGNGSMLVQPWVPTNADVDNYGVNGVGPWGFRGGISGSADWIWPTGQGCGVCTIDLSTPIYTNSVSPEPASMILFGSGVVGLFGVLRRKLMM